MLAPFRFLSAFRERVSGGMDWFIEHMYMPFLRRVIRVRYLSMCVAIAVFLFTISLISAGYVKFVLFSDVDGDMLTATIEFPNGTPIEKTEQAVLRLEDAIHKVAEKAKTASGEPLLTNLYSVVGGIISDDPFAGGGSGTPYKGSVRAQLLESQFRGLSSEALKYEWERETGDIPGVVSFTIEGQGGGPPGKPIEVWVQGQDMNTILAAADELKVHLAQYTGVSQIETDFRPGKNEIKFELKPEAHTLGITVSDLAQQVYSGFYGEEALRLQRGRDDVRVRVRYPLDERKTLADLEQVRIRTPQGYEVPLQTVASASYGPGYASIIRTNAMRRVAVTADVDKERANTNEVIADLQENYFDTLISHYPGLSVSVEGSQRDTTESLNSLYIGFPLALVGIFVIIATIFRSYMQPFIIMFTVPFGIIGAIFAHLLMGYDVTMMSLFGIVALAGVVVNDAIVLIECVNDYLAEGAPFYKAIELGGTRRFRAIFLTSVTTVGGLVSLIFAKDMQAKFLVPMALSLAAGVGFATILTLLLIPCLMGILNDFRRIARRMISGVWLAPEEVEPARFRNDELLSLDSAPQPEKPAAALDSD